MTPYEQYKNQAEPKLSLVERAERDFRYDLIKSLIYTYAPDGWISVYPSGPVVYELIGRRGPGFGDIGKLMDIIAAKQIRVAVEVMDAMMITHDPAVVMRAVLRSYLPSIDWENITVAVQKRQHSDGMHDFVVVIHGRAGAKLEIGTILTVAQLVDEQLLAKIVLAVG